MFIKNLVIIIILLIFASCNKDTGKKTLQGYSYDVLRSGTGAQAKIGDHAYFNVITMAKDSVMEDTHIYPFEPTLRLEAKPPREIAAIVDVLREMHVGDSVLLHVPIDSLPFAKIEFQSYKEIKHLVTLDNLKSDDEFKKDMEERTNFLRKMAGELQSQDSIRKKELITTIRDYKDKKTDSQMKTTANGVKILILKEGNGIMPKSGDMIEVNYTGGLTNEFIFDSSFPQGQPYVYRINTGQVIKGWDDALSTFKEGTEAYIFIPSDMGYGATGSNDIPPNSELIFYVNLYKVRPMHR